MRDTKELLMDSAKKGRRLAELRNQSGWVDLIDILNLERADDMKVVTNPASPESEVWLARAGLIKLENILSQIDSAIEIGKQAEEKLERLQGSNKTAQ